MIEVRGLRYAWPGSGHDTLAIPELQVGAGRTLFLHGESGCGKSTLLALLAGVLVAQRGTVSLLGQDWAALAPAARDARRADHVGVIFQQFNLLPYLSVIDNVLMPCRFSRRRAARAREVQRSERAAAQALLEALGLEASLWRRGAAELSVGQQQRVAAARALIGQPELVIADEPTSALDEDRRDAFMRLLVAQCERSRSALLFVSHDSRLAPYFGQVVDLPLANRARGAADSGRARAQAA